MGAFPPSARLGRYLADRETPNLSRASGQRLVYELKALGEFFAVSPGTLRAWIRAGRLHAVKRYRGGKASDPRSWRWLVTREEVERFFMEWLGGGRLQRPATENPRGPDGRYIRASEKSAGS